MFRYIVMAALGLSLLVVAAPSALAKGDMTHQDPIEVRVEMGSYFFRPDNLVFETGKLYKLKLVNASDEKHEFDSQMLAHSVFTRKVEIVDEDGEMISEVKGIPNHVELAPGEYALEWWFVPVATGEGELLCDLEGHKEQGMHGKVTIH